MQNSKVHETSTIMRYIKHLLAQFWHKHLVKKANFVKTIVHNFLELQVSLNMCISG